MARYFKLGEFVSSSTAKMRGIDNTPSGDVISHLNELMSVLDDLRAYVGYPIRISSGYRCRELNRAVGGAVTSAHQYGWAADLQCPSLPFDVFVNTVDDWLEMNNVRYDQVIRESNGRSKWLHFGLRAKDGSQRMRKFRIDK